MNQKLKFEWDTAKDTANQRKHGVSFDEAKQAFYDKNRVFRPDRTHSITEERMFCFGKVGRDIMTVRFTMRDDNIRIIGAAYWREGRLWYEEDSL